MILHWGPIFTYRHRNARDFFLFTIATVWLIQAVCDDRADETAMFAERRVVCV